jgi:hypothetical protein
MSVTCLTKYTWPVVIRRTQLDEIQAEINRLELKKKELNKVSYLEEAIYPLAKALNRHLKKEHYEVLGPFGLGCHISIHFYDGESFDKDKKAKGITLSPHNLFEDGSIQVIDESKDDGSFAKGTLGHINGLNYTVIPIKPTTPIKDLLQYVR